MSAPRGNGQNGGHFYSNITQPVKIDISFIVDSSNANGLGIRSLKSNGYVQSVYMHTSATPASGNPNPAVGIAVIRLNNNFNKFLSAYPSLVSPVTGSSLTSTVANVSYAISVLGTATAAQWQAKGFPAGFTPAIGAGFVATASGVIGGSGAVKAIGQSGINSIEVMSDSDQTISNSAIAANGGAQVMVQFLNNVTPTAPTNETVVKLALNFDASSVTIDGL